MPYFKLQYCKQCKRMRNIEKPCSIKQCCIIYFLERKCVRQFANIKEALYSPCRVLVRIFPSHCIFSVRSNRGDITVNCSIAHRAYIITFPRRAYLYRVAQPEERHVRDARDAAPDTFPRRILRWLPVRRSSLVCGTKERVLNSRLSLNVATRRRNNK